MENTVVTALRAVLSNMAPTAVAEIARRTIQPQLYNSEQLEVIDGEIIDWVQKAISGEVGGNGENALQWISRPCLIQSEAGKRAMGLRKFPVKDTNTVQGALAKRANEILGYS